MTTKWKSTILKRGIVFVVFAMVCIVLLYFLKKNNRHERVVLFAGDNEHILMKEENTGNSEVDTSIAVNDKNALTSGRNDRREEGEMSLTHSSDLSETLYPPIRSEVDEEVPETKVLTYPVYITGEVKEEGVYHFEDAIYLYELIEMAGGFLDTAAKRYYNLASQVEKNSHIHILSEVEVEELREEDISAYSLTHPILHNEDSDLIASTEEVSNLLDINTANQASLETLAGIGSQTAIAIIQYREENGPFASIEDIMNVPGIKDAKFQKIKDYITVDFSF